MRACVHACMLMYSLTHMNISCVSINIRSKRCGRHDPYATAQERVCRSCYEESDENANSHACQDSLQCDPNRISSCMVVRCYKPRFAERSLKLRPYLPKAVNLKQDAVISASGLAVAALQRCPQQRSFGLTVRFGVPQSTI